MVNFANFDGSQGVVVVSGYQGVAATRHRSIAFWIRTTQTGLATICWWGDDVSSNIPDGSECRVRLIDGYVELFGKGSGRKSAMRVNDGNFHHVVLTWSLNDASYGHEDFQVANIIIDSVIDNGKQFGGGKRIISSDGIEISTTAINTPEETRVLIGARPDGAGGYTEFFQGDLDEFAVYNVVMASGTISGAYNLGVRGADLLTSPQLPALQFWYRMGDDPGDVIPVLPVASGTFVDQNPFTQRHAMVASGVTIS
jgi:hypothetical protein